MKKLIYAIMAVMIAFSLTACVTINVVAPESGENTPQKEETQISPEQQETPSQSGGQQTEQQPADEAPPQTDTPQQPEEEIPPQSDTPQQPAEEKPQQSYEELENLYSQWAQVVGYWNAAEGVFAVVDMMDSHTLCFLSGIWEAGGRDLGMVTDIRSDAEYELTAVVEYDYYDDGERITSTEKVVIDYSGLDRDGKISIGVNGQWRQYMFAGNTMDEAYQTYYDNTYGG